MDGGGVGWLLRATDDGALVLSWTSTIRWASCHRPARMTTGLGLCKMFVSFEAFVEGINTIIRKHPLCLGTPTPLCIAHMITQYSVSLRPSCIAMHATRYS